MGASDRLPDGVTIRPARPEDAEALTHLHLDVWDDAYTGLMAQSILDERREHLDERVGRWRQILEDHDRTLVAVGPEGLVGFASAGPGRDHALDIALDIDLEVWALYLREQRWGTGVGYALLQTAIGDRAAYLWVLHGNDRAVRFYERQGFRLDGTEDEHAEGLHVRMVRVGT